MTFFDFLATIQVLIGRIIPVLISLALLLFLWGLVKFMWSASQGSEDAVAEGRRFMVWGIITLFVLVSVWGLVGVLTQFSGISPGGQPPPIPQLPGAPSGGNGAPPPLIDCGNAC